MANAYKQAGVDIEAGYEAVSRMKKHVQTTMRKEVLGGLGGFGGMFDLSKFCIRRTCISIWNRWRGNEIDARFYGR